MTPRKSETNTPHCATFSPGGRSLLGGVIIVKLRFLCSLLVAFSALAASTVGADDAVRGHIRKDGTYVAPHFRSDSNNRLYDNYSAQGNVNPYTGHRGTQRHEFSNPPAYPKGSGMGSYNTPNPYSAPSAPRQPRSR